MDCSVPGVFGVSAAPDVQRTLTVMSAASIVYLLARV